VSEPLFKEVNYSLNSLIQYIAIGQIGLPDIQRPFVWPNAKVRDLFDSMYRGYPVGYLLFWQNGLEGHESRTIGQDQKQKFPSLLIVDGQQRLTSLYAVVRGVPVVRENYAAEGIEIAFNPLTENFEVADAAIRRDPAFIPNISILLNDKSDLFELVDDYLLRLSASRELSDFEKKQIKNAINRLSKLGSFPFTALELASTVTEEEVSEVFVRVNSKGTPLNQADFILTLMSVFWDDGRRQLETFSREARVPSAKGASPYNHYIRPDPDQLLRVAVGLGFKRARLQFVYSLLRGKDLDSGMFSAGRRDEQFAVLKKAQAEVVNLAHWHDFFHAIRQAGYRGGKWISSTNGLLYAYVFYLIGRTEYHVDEHILRRTIAKWFFMSSLTARYTSSPESAMEADLARLRGITNAQDFIKTLNQVCDTSLTSDFWTITLPNELATSAAQSPSLYAYFAALILLDAKVLFSKQRVVDLVDPSVHSSRAAVERHHLFPKAYLQSMEIHQTRDINQIGNYALVEWIENVKIGARSPSEYLPEHAAKFSGKDLQKMYRWHALPDGWEKLSYPDFLTRRRELIARVIHDGYSTLTESDIKLPPDITIPIHELATRGESITLEYKATLRTNLHTYQVDPRMELSCLKTISAFLNSRNGGTLLIGVMDNGTAVGIEADGFLNEDKMLLHLDNLIKTRIGVKHMMYIHPHFEDYDGCKVLAVECSPSNSPVFVKDGSMERFYIRMGASSPELSTSDTYEYIKERYK
jgi:hypothetical protein